MVLGEPTSAPTIQTTAKAFCPAEFINTLIEKIHPWHSVCIKAVTPWSVQFTLGSHRANFYASSESDGRIKVLSTWGSGESMESLSQYTDQMNGFAKHINGILEGKIRDDEGKLVEVLLHDKPQDGVCTYVLYGTGNKHFDGRSCEVIDHPNPGGKCQVRVGESVTWVDRSMLWKLGQIQVVKECLTTDHSFGSRNKVDHSVGANKLVPPAGYRLLHESAKADPRKAGDWYWSLKLRKWIVLRDDVVEYANRDDWPACRLGQPNSAIKQSLTPDPPDGWRWLELGEVMRNGDTDRSMEPIPKDWIGSVCRHKNNVLRRNRFEVGEKVVHGFGDRQSISVVENILGDGWVDLVRDGVSTAYHVKDLAPHIEETA